MASHKPRVCRDGHPEIAHADSEHEQCPLCQVLGSLREIRDLAIYCEAAAVCSEARCLRDRAAIARADEFIEQWQSRAAFEPGKDGANG